jgi:lysosomal acid lipase/cholesteryl ester hydrolase
MIRSEGYPVEVHHVVTRDGYILTLHRIPASRNEEEFERKRTKPAVLVNHGLLCSSADWVMGAPEKSLGES